MKPFVLLIIIGIIGLLALLTLIGGVRIYNNKIINNFNENAEKIYVKLCLFSTKLIPEEEYNLAKKKKGDVVL